MGRPGNRSILSVIIPTITGREHWLARALASIRETVVGYEILIYTNEPSCGVGWNKGIEEARGDYILLFADDLEAHEGWYAAGVAALEQGIIPCPRILNPDGSLQSCGTYAEEAENGTPSVVARVPLLTHEMAEALYPIFDKHYMGDHWITWKGEQLGWPTQVVREMVFTHHFAMEGRIDSLSADVKAYHRATR